MRKCNTIEYKSSLVPKMDINNSSEDGSSSEQNNFNKTLSIEGTVTKPPADEYKIHHLNKKQTENSKTDLMKQITEDGFLVFNDFSIKKNDKPKEQSRSNLVPNMVVNKSYKNYNFSKKCIIFTKMSRAKCDEASYNVVSKNQCFINNKQNCIKQRISNISEAEDDCIIIDDSSKISADLFNAKKDYPSSLMPHLGINSSYSVKSNLNINSTCINKNLPEDLKYKSLEQNCKTQNPPIIMCDLTDSNENSNRNEKGLQIKNKSINVPMKINQQNKCNKEFAVLKNNEYSKFVINNSFSSLFRKLKVKRIIPFRQHTIPKKQFYDAKTNTKKRVLGNVVLRIVPNNLNEVSGVTEFNKTPTSIGKDTRIKSDGSLINANKIIPKECVENNQFSQNVISKPTYTQAVSQKKLGFGKPMRIKERCNICGSLFKDLPNHLKNMHFKLSRFVCDLCGEIHENYSSLINHEKLHKYNECYPCDRCDKQFYNGMLLVEHMRKEHKVFVPFQCQRCDELFEKKSCLNMHYAIQFCYFVSLPKCNGCNIRFPQQKNLDKHQKKKHCRKSQIEYYCNHCDAYFKSKESVKIHLKARHDRNSLAFKNNQNVSNVEKLYFRPLAFYNNFIGTANKRVKKSEEPLINLEEFKEKIDEIIKVPMRNTNKKKHNIIYRKYQYTGYGCIDGPNDCVEMSNKYSGTPKKPIYCNDEWLEKLSKYIK